MTARASIRHSAVATALSLVGYRMEQETALRNVRTLARDCRRLEQQCQKERVRYPAHRIANDSAKALETLAKRFRGAARQLQPKGEKPA